MNKKHSKTYYERLKEQLLEDLTLAEHAEIWYYNKNNDIPDRNTSEWDEMYTKWIVFAFSSIDKKSDLNYN